MNCLCCGKPIRPDSPEENSGWHDKCVRAFFGTKKLPDIDMSAEVLEKLARESTNRGFTVPGVQKKLSLHLTRGQEPRLTLVNYPTGFILKPQTAEYPALPEAEYLVMQMARACGIKTVPFALVRIPAQGGALAYITRRIDRVLPTAEGEPVKLLAMEDFCQLDGRLTMDKYHGSYERCAKIISRYSIRPGLDLSELFLRVAFSLTVGNSDMHLKNFSLIETVCGSEEYVLSEAYDMLPVNTVLPEDTEQLALTVNGKKRNVRRKDLLIFAEAAGLPRASVEKMLEKLDGMKDCLLAMCADSYLPDDMKAAFAELIADRLA